MEFASRFVRINMLLPVEHIQFYAWEVELFSCDFIFKTILLALSTSNKIRAPRIFNFLRRAPKFDRLLFF